MSGRAIDHYHRLLDGPLAAETDGAMREELRRRGLYFGERPLCTVLRPRFLSPAQHRLLRRRMRELLGAFAAVEAGALEDASLRAQLRLQDWEERLALEDPGFPASSPISRIDAFFTDDGESFRLTEYNAETPAGTAYGDALSDVFLALPVMREFLREWELRPLPTRHGVLHALLSSWQSFSGRREKPSIAILDWSDVPTRNEFVLTADYLTEHGLECRIGDPRQCSYEGGRLLLDGQPVDLVYKRVLISELIEREGFEHALVRAVGECAVCMVNPFRCKLLHKKATLAVLSDERNVDLFTPSQRAAIGEHVPWTRVVEERRTMHDGREVDLLEHVAEHRDRFVLKPNDEYGGTGIVLGWEVDDAAWRRALESATAEPFIVQERITLPREPYPALVDGGLHVGERIVDTAPFAFGGTFVDGCLSRLSTDSLVNVTAGGGSSVPTFVIEHREEGA